MKEKECVSERGVKVGYRNWTAIGKKVRERETAVKNG